MTATDTTADAIAAAARGEGHRAVRDRAVEAGRSWVARSWRGRRSGQGVWDVLGGGRVDRGGGSARVAATAAAAGGWGGPGRPRAGKGLANPWNDAGKW